MRPAACFADEPRTQHFESYVGLDYAGRTASAFNTTFWSPFGSVLSNGFRLRVDSITNLSGETNAAVFSSAFLPKDVTMVSNLMAGYQFEYSQIWIKAFAGAAYSGDVKIFYRTLQQSQMQQWGAKATLDAWYRVNSRVWVSASANYLQIGKNASLYSKGAYEVWKGERLVVALGGEASAGLGEQRFFDAGRRLNAFGDYYRGGGLVNIRYGSHDVSLSGGMSGNSDESRLWPYVTLNYGRKF